MTRKPFPYKRKRAGKTNYNRRKLLLASGKNRLVIRKSSNNILLQIIKYEPDGDKIIVSANSNELQKLGWNASRKNLPAAYLTGLLLGKKALKNKIGEAVLDLGLQASTKGSRLYAALKGAIDAGMKIPHSKEVFPDEARIKGSHIKQYLEQQEQQEQHSQSRFQFSLYKKNNINLNFEEVRTKI